MYFLVSLKHPSLEGRCTPWVNAQESQHHNALFVTNADKMAVAFKDQVGIFCGTEFNLANFLR